jgi:adenylate cyclase
VIGDTVNLASRLQSLTKEVGRDILVNETTCLLVRDGIPASTSLPPIEIRGKQKPVNVFAVELEKQRVETGDWRLLRNLQFLLTN